MIDPPSKPWLAQASSDFHTANLIFERDEERLYCHSIAKYQQAVEKSIKGIAAAVNNVGMQKLSPGFSHDVGDLVKILMKLPAKRHPSISTQILGLFQQSVRNDVRDLGNLAPRRPPPRLPYRRNTEYPFQTGDEIRLAPTDPGTFDRDEVKRFRDVAYRIVSTAMKIVAAIEFGP